MSKNNFKFYFSNRKQKISFFGISPSFDWKIMLLISILVFVTGAIYIGYVYMQIVNESLFEVSEVQEESIDIEKQTKEIEAFVSQIKQRTIIEPQIIPEVPEPVATTTVESINQTILENFDE